jgi:membrane protein DedA with SNARE-associated domain
VPAVAVLLAVSIADVLRDFGYAGLAVLMVVENVFPPIPSEAVLPLAGYFVGRGELSFPLVLATATAGSVGGSVILYEFARTGGRPFARRFLNFARQDPDRLEQAEEWFDRRGAAAVLLGRCVPGVRSAISLPAGALRMRRVKYILLTMLGTAVWNTALIGAGWLLGREWDRVSDVVGGLATPLLIVAAVAVAGLLVWWSLRRRRAERSGG